MSASDISLEADHISGIKAPQTKKTLYGHHDIIERLFRQYEQNRLPGGLLLHGPKGIGKATLAYELARKITYASGSETISQVNEQIGAGVHPNIRILRRSPREKAAGFYQNIRVDEVRSLLGKLHQTRGRAGRRIIIVDSVDDCNSNAANALLKTLEEPPEKTHLILISNRVGALLPTLRSRCQGHAMRPLANDIVEKILSDPEITDEVKGKTEISTAIDFSGGRPRRAFEALSMGNIGVLKQLSDWLQNPATDNGQTMMEISDILGNKKNRLEAEFARELLLDWITNEAKSASTPNKTTQNIAPTQTLASSIELWEKANRIFETGDSFNLDLRQSFIVLFDHISSHAQLKLTR
ncbi:MAG: AAA family ATPase [Devosiaceae bacterium]|nr:AAA family ATPase [Devosiaceae bacterium]